ncbi:LamG domain-containing protein [Pedobacter gandavensis]|uniref:LamG domain-containing protein n=1 Tax=Pedobacter gandavensis TaxID=2679963 RepID=UPI00292D6107|nr:LamG domain-containing protein [Pedobacter gandavensis]
MKTRLFYILSAAAVSLAVSSCTKKFDPSSYAPALNIGGYTSSKEVASANLVAHWAFDGSLIDSVSKVSGVSTSTSFAAGTKGNALQGSSAGYVISDTPSEVQKLKSFTTTLWFNSDLNTGATGLIDIANTTAGWGNLTVFLENGGDAANGVIQFRVNNNGVLTASENIKVPGIWKKWTHLALSYDQISSNFILYINGGKTKTMNVPNNGALTFQNATKMVFGTLQFQTTPSLTTGGGKESWAANLNGKLDEVRIFNKALTADEIGALSKLESKGK